jgi:hypothetical protein
MQYPFDGNNEFSRCKCGHIGQRHCDDLDPMSGQPTDTSCLECECVEYRKRSIKDKPSPAYDAWEKRLNVEHVRSKVNG